MKLTFMISAFLLTVSSSVPVEIFVKGTEGEQGFLNCPYSEGYENSDKYFYKGPYRESKLLLKSAGGQSSVSEGRFSLLDDHQKRSLTLIIRNLSLTDAGLYSCGAGWSREYKNIQLKVIRVSSSVPVDITMRGTEGEQGFLNCPYAEGYENSDKYFYKGPYRERNLLLKSAGGQSSVSEGRFSLLDYHQKRSFTLIIRNLSLSDAGLYSCGAGWGRQYKNIQLKVIRAPQKTRPDQISTSTLHSYTHTSTVTPRTGRETTRTMTGSTAVQHDQPNTECTNYTTHDATVPVPVLSFGSFVIIITAALVLLLIGLPLIIVTVWKKEKNKGLLSSSIVEFNQVIHEQIKHAGRHCNPEDRDTETTVVYSCVS